jgi:Ca-activated chloride channel family protein
VLAGLDAGTLRAAQPLYLWLLIAPALLLVVALWRLARRRGDVRRASGTRLLPVTQRLPYAGELAFWIVALLATSLCIVALARPQATVATVRRGGADFVVLQDGSASMYARDVEPDRWQRSVRFLRTFGDSLSWKGERVALALFAHLAAPQVRLTKDPNALFFFLDHLGKQSPFRLEDNPTWDTNIEEGLRWGLNLIAKDEEVFGRTSHVKAAIVISDGQAWSGEIANALARARERNVWVYVVGVGTTAGAMIPPPGSNLVSTEPPLRASLDRESLRDIARAGGGEYYEIGRESDREIAARIIASVRRRATVVAQADTHVDLHWHALFAAALVLAAGVWLVRGRTELWWHTASFAVALLVLATAFR